MDTHTHMHTHTCTDTHAHLVSHCCCHFQPFCNRGFETGADMTLPRCPRCTLLPPIAATAAVGHCMPAAKRSMKANAYPSTKQSAWARSSRSFIVATPSRPTARLSAWRCTAFARWPPVVSLNAAALLLVLLLPPPAATRLCFVCVSQQFN